VPVAAVMLSTTDQPRNVLLADGSRLSIAPASEVRIVLGRAGRLAEIRKGRVRVAVKAENRPFVIVAGRSRVEADEGVFDARLVEGDGTVAPARSAWTAGAPAAGQPAGGAHPHMEFAAEPLGQAVVRVNGLHAGPPIEIEPALAGLPVTGIVDRGGSRSIAQSLAAAFDLDLVETSAGALRLQRRKDDQQSSRTWRRPARPGPAFS
jgi:ferric-dicitrate binding protein FerR (iron transport regulator)